ncbi:MAG: DUF4166 domain-containing protein, partial [Lysinibacillus sp.]
NTGTKLLQPFYHLASKSRFLFPESGEKIPFQITNLNYINEHGEMEVYWERVFYFPNATRQFNAKMTIDMKKRIVKDYLGDPSFFYSDLRFDVTSTGHLLIRSGKQKFVCGALEVPMPSILEGRVIVEEGYDDEKDVFTIHVSIYNDIFGRMMMYAGEFSESIS